MLGYILARAGIDVVVLEKWPDFFRDFRGDTIHPATMQNLHELGLLEKFLALPHQKTRQIVAHVNGEEVVLADFSYLSARSPFVAFSPQWDFLNFLSGEAKKLDTFTLLMNTEATDVIKEGERVVGVRGKGPDGELEIHADLIVGADGRHSTMREKGSFEFQEAGVPIDVLWFRLSARTTDPEQSFGYIDDGKIMVMLDRGDYWQCGFVISKGDFDHIQNEGLEKFKFTIARLAPFISPSVVELTSWDQIKLLSVTIDRAKKWHNPGILLIGDAAHAMSPIGGVGINLAIQDAIAAGNILVPAFRGGKPQEKHLQMVQSQREFPTKMTQRLQTFAQDRILIPYLQATVRKKEVPWFFRLFHNVPLLRAIPALAIGNGFRPEHVTVDFGG
jgi:2-polyprenyl-6-methoxyphenol hydroxylase-like FAD-dependent oxidoreductase